MTPAKILVIDDEPSIQSVVAAYLKVEDMIIKLRLMAVVVYHLPVHLNQISSYWM